MVSIFLLKVQIFIIVIIVFEVKLRLSTFFFEFVETIALVFLVSNEKIVVVKTLKKLSQDNQKKICRHFRSRKIISTHYVKK